MNTNYYRTRRELFDELMACVDPPNGTVQCHLLLAEYLSIRSFLNSRNEGLSDDKRLAFDTAVLNLQALAIAAIAA